MGRRPWNNSEEGVLEEKYVGLNCVIQKMKWDEDEKRISKTNVEMGGR